MLSAEDRARLASERSALAAYLRGDKSQPFILERQEAYCIDAVLCPSLLARLRMAWRYMMVSLGGIMPFCPLKVFFYHLAGAKIGKNVCISPGVIVDPLFPELVELEDGACLGMGCRLMTHEYTATHFRIGRIRVGKGAVVGGYSTVRSGVSIGEKATVGFNSLVNRDVPPGDVVGGVPAKSLKSRGESS